MALALTATPARTIEAKLSGAPSPIWQTNLTVWALAYADGRGLRRRRFHLGPAGRRAARDRRGPRSHIAAFDAATGDLLPFAPTADARVRTLAVGPNGKVLYIGGNFTLIDGVTRNHAAAVDANTGALTGWAGGTNGAVLAMATSGTTVYMGGTFTEVKGVARTGLAAVSNTGVLQPWDPGADNTVSALTVTPDGSRVVAGGAFDILAGVAEHGLGAVDPTTGAATAWASAPRCPDAPRSTLWSPMARGSMPGADGAGVGCFDGTLAVRPAGRVPGVAGLLSRRDAGPGRHRRLPVLGLARARLRPGARWDAEHPARLPSPARRAGERRLPGGCRGSRTRTRRTTGLGRWPPTGRTCGWAGDFTTVQGTAQQGLAWFGPGPDTTTPTTPIKPVAISTAAGTVSVSWPASTDLDDDEPHLLPVPRRSTEPDRDAPGVLDALDPAGPPVSRHGADSPARARLPGERVGRDDHLESLVGLRTRGRVGDVAAADLSGDGSRRRPGRSTGGSVRPRAPWRRGRVGARPDGDVPGRHVTGGPGAIPDDPDTAVGLDGMSRAGVARPTDRSRRPHSPRSCGSRPRRSAAACSSGYGKQKVGSTPGTTARSS